jgi:hypothetical protein
MERTKLTREERDAMNARVTELQRQYQTKEELAAAAAAKTQKELQASLENTTREREIWQKRYESNVISTELTKAAVQHKAYNPDQILAILSGSTKLVEVLDEDGKPTGQLVPKVTLQDVDKNKKPVTLELDPVQAIERLKAREEFQNLFLAEGSSGFGGGQKNKSSGQVDIAQLAKDPAAYRKYRKDHSLASITKSLEPKA